MNIHIPIKEKNVLKIVIGLLLVEAALVGIYVFDFVSGHPYWQICELFDLDREANIPTWFSTLLLFLIGALALLINSRQNDPSPPTKRLLTILGLGFLYLSMDEASAIHEKITYVFYDNPMVPYFEGVHGVWIVTYGFLGILIALFVYKDLIEVFKTFRRESILFCAGLLVYLIGAAGAETITFFQLDKSNPMIYTIEVILEESFEITGMILILGSMLLLASKKLK